MRLLQIPIIVSNVPPQPESVGGVLLWASQGGQSPRVLHDSYVYRQSPQILLTIRRQQVYGVTRHRWEVPVGIKSKRLQFW